MDDLLYGSDLSFSERAYQAEDLYDDIEIGRLMLMNEMVEKRHEINLLKAELKCFEENGTYDDLNYLYCEAEEEKEQRQGGIISKIVGAIAGAFKAIINSIKSFFTGNKSGNPDEEREVDEEGWNLGKKITSEWDKVSSQLQGDQSDVNHWTEQVPKILGAVVAVAGTIMGAKFVGKKIKVRAEDQEKQGTKISNMCQTIVNITDKINNSAIAKALRTPFDAIRNGLNKLLSAIGIKKTTDETQNDHQNGKAVKNKNNANDVNTNDNDQTKKNDPDYKEFKRQKRQERLNNAKINGTVLDQSEAAANMRSIITKNENILPFIKNGKVNEVGIVDAIKTGNLKEKDIRELFNEPMVQKDSRSSGRGYRISRKNLTLSNVDKMVNDNRMTDFNQKYLLYLCKAYRNARVGGN